MKSTWNVTHGHSNTSPSTQKCTNTRIHIHKPSHIQDGPVINTGTRVHTDTPTHPNTSTPTPTNMRTHAYVHTHTHTQTRTYTHEPIHTHTHTHRHRPVHASSGRSPLHTATSTDNLSVAIVLLSHHVDVNARDDHGDTPLIIASQRDNAQVCSRACAHV